MMLKQTTLDGKKIEGELTAWEMKLLIKKADKIAEENPKYFAEEICAMNGVAYHGERGKPTSLDVLRCYDELTEAFGAFTENMANALIMYPIEDDMKKSLVRTKRVDYDDEEVEPETDLEEDTKRLF